MPDIWELERRLNRSLATKLPQALLRKSRRIAIDLTLIPYHGQPQLFLELLRFREMLLWIGQVVGRMLAADKIQGIDRETYQRVTKNR